MGIDPIDSGIESKTHRQVSLNSHVNGMAAASNYLPIKNKTACTCPPSLAKTRSCSVVAFHQNSKQTHQVNTPRAQQQMFCAMPETLPTDTHPTRPSYRTAHSI
eukprot:5967058-Amphidinium_carterae.1